MKRIVSICLLLIAGGFLFANEELELYSMLYKNARNTSERLGILNAVVEAGIPGSGAFYADTLSTLLRNQSNLTTVTERYAADESAIILCNKLGEEKYVDAATTVWRTYEMYRNPFVKEAALVALGRMKAVNLLPQVIKVLTDLNESPTSDPEASEKIAYGAIISLEKYQESAGYIPVFFASIGWYTERIKTQARNSLPIILEDPVVPLTEIINGSSYNINAKYQALRTLEASRASNSEKASGALAAYTEGWRRTSPDTQTRLLMGNMRKLAIDMIQRYGTEDKAVYPLLERSYKEGQDWEEKLGSVSTLAALKSVESAQLLSQFMMIMNGKLQSHSLTQDDERMVRALIPALGATGQGAARSSLRTILSLDWTNAVKNLANEALKQIP